MNEDDGYRDWLARVMIEFARIQNSCGYPRHDESPKEEVLREGFAELMEQQAEVEQKEKDAAIGFLVHDTFRLDR